MDTPLITKAQVRAVADAYGCQSRYNGTTKTFFLKGKRSPEAAEVIRKESTVFKAVADRSKARTKKVAVQ